MALSASTLKSQIEAMANTAEEVTACANWASGFNEYFKGAGCNGAPVAPAALVAAKAAMQGALVGMSGPGQGSVKLQAAIIAYWGALIPAVAWPPATVITPPPGLAGLAPALVAAFLSNTTGKKSKADSAQAIATAIHAIMIVGGLGVFPPPIGPMPIL